MNKDALPTGTRIIAAAWGATLCVLLMGFSPPVAAHGGHGASGFRSFQVGPYDGTMDVQPFPVYADSQAAFTLVVGKNRAIEHPPGRMEISGPGGYETTLTLVKGDFGYDLPVLTLGAAGNYSVRVVVQNGSSDHSQSVYYDVVPAVAASTPAAKEAPAPSIVWMAVAVFVALAHRSRLTLLR